MADPLLTVKDRLDALLKLSERSWTQFNFRRDVEWKLAMAIWTALLAFLGIVITGKLIHISPCGMLGLYILPLLIFLIHIVWFYWARQAHDVDQGFVFGYEEEIWKTLGIELRMPRRLEISIGITNE